MKAAVGIMKPFKRRIPDKKIAEVFTMIQQGLTIREIGKLSEIAQPKVARMLRCESYQNLRRV